MGSVMQCVVLCLVMSVDPDLATCPNLDQLRWLSLLLEFGLNGKGDADCHAVFGDDCGSRFSNLPKC